MIRRFFTGMIYGIAMGLPLPAVVASTPLAAIAASSALFCCKNLKSSCVCGSYTCCKTNCTRAKALGICLLTNCTDACGAKYPTN